MYAHILPDYAEVHAALQRVSISHHSAEIFLKEGFSNDSIDTMGSSSECLDVEESEFQCEDMDVFLPLPQALPLICNNTSWDLQQDFLMMEGRFLLGQVKDYDEIKRKEIIHLTKFIALLSEIFVSERIYWCCMTEHTSSEPRHFL